MFLHIAWDKSSEYSDHESVPGTQVTDIRQGNQYERE